jgi:hypothetical protein
MAWAPHDILKEWLYLDSRHEDFEPTIVIRLRVGLIGVGL